MARVAYREDFYDFAEALEILEGNSIVVALAEGLEYFKEAALVVLHDEGNIGLLLRLLLQLQHAPASRVKLLKVIHYSRRPIKI